MGFAERLKELRDGAGLSQEQLADRLGIPRSSLTNYEAGGHERLPRRDRLERLADFFGVSVDYLLARTDRKEAAGANAPELGGINVAYFGGAKVELTEEEAERLQEELEMFRLLKAKRLRERSADLPDEQG